MKSESKQSPQPAVYVIAAIILIVCAWALLTSARDGREDELMSVVKKIEENLVMPEGAYDLSMYDRYYAKGEGKEADIIFGLLRYRRNGKGGIHLIKYSSLPIIFDGGCNVVRIRYSIVERRILSKECNGEA